MNSLRFGLCCSNDKVSTNNDMHQSEQDFHTDICKITANINFNHHQELISGPILHRFSLFPSYASYHEKLSNIPGLEQFREDFVVQNIIAEGGEGRVVQIKSRKQLSNEIRHSNNNNKLFAAKYILCKRKKSKSAMTMKIKQMSEYELIQSSNLLNYYRIYHYTDERNFCSTHKKRFQSKIKSKIKNSMIFSLDTNAGTNTNNVSNKYCGCTFNSISINNDSTCDYRKMSKNDGTADDDVNDDINVDINDERKSNISTPMAKSRTVSRITSNVELEEEFMLEEEEIVGKKKEEKETQEWMIIVSQLLYKSLTDYVQCHVHDMNEDRMQPIIKSVVQHLAILHDENYIHLDLRPDNIMCVARGKNKVWKIIDYGFREKIYTHSLCTRSGVKWKGIFGFTAPEFSVYVKDFHRNQLSFSADIWVIGVLVLFCMFGGCTEKLFPEEIYNLMLGEGGNDGNIETQTKVMHIWYQYLHNGRTGFKSVVNDIRKGKYQAIMSIPLQDLLINHVLIYDPHLRENSCKKLLKHPWFQQ